MHSEALTTLGRLTLLLRRGAVPVLIAAVTLAYGNGLHGPFVFDDARSIEENQSIRHLWPVTRVLASERNSPVAARPLTNLSLALNYAVGHLAVTGYHVTNVMLHVLASLVLFAVLRRLFAMLGRAPRGATTNAAALIAALLWSVHPLNSETVDYITQRTESLAGLFWLCTVYCAIRYLDRRQLRWMLCAAAAHVLGVASKESAVTAPLVVLLYDRYCVSGSTGDALRRHRRLYGVLAIGWIVCALLLPEAPFFRADSFSSPGGAFARAVSPWVYLLNQPRLIVHYVGLAAAPYGLVVDYGAPIQLSLRTELVPVAVVLTALAAVVAAIVRRHQLGFWGAWFFITLAPASGLVPIPTEVGAERRMYLPLIALIAGCAAMLVHACNPVLNSTDTRARQLRHLAIVVAVLMTTTLMMMTRRRNSEYASSLALWQTVVERRPNPRAYVNYAAALGDAGKSDDAVHYLRLAAPELLDARRVLGFELLIRGDAAGAITQLEEFLRDAPSDRDASTVRLALAGAYSDSLEFDKARAHLETATRLDPASAVLHLALAQVLLASGDVEEADRRLRRALELGRSDIAALTQIRETLANARQSLPRSRALLDQVDASPSVRVR